MNKKLEIKKQSGRPSTPHKAGFTLIELMVSSAIFIIVMVISIGAVLSIVDANRKAQSLNSVITNLNFAIESMIRDMREGTDYKTPDCGTPPCTSITFVDSNGQNVSYHFVKDFATGIGSIIKTTPTFSSTITASEVNIQSTSFYVSGNSLNDGQQPNVLFVMNGIAGNQAKTRSTYRVETLVTQRLLDS